MGTFLSAKSMVTQEVACVWVCENMWHDLVKVTIRRWCTHRSAQAFRVPTLLYWQSCSEMFGVKWHKLAHQKMMMMMMVFANFLIAANKP
jgi:hypothetical protein